MKQAVKDYYLSRIVVKRGVIAGVRPITAAKQVSRYDVL